MANIELDGNTYQVIKSLESDNRIYYYTLDVNHDNEVVILSQNMLDKGPKFEKVAEHEYPILMNKFAIK